MKKIVSLLLVFVMVLSSFSMAFAAGDAVVVETTKSNEQLAGEFLSTAGILKGEDGDLKLDAALTREQAMLMIARLMGKEDEALNNKLTSTFKDAKNNAYWAPVVAWAESLKLTNGMGDGTFGLGKETNMAQVQTWYLRVLGFEAKWEGTSLDSATAKTVEELGMMTAVGTTFNRGAMAIMTINTLKATPKDAKETLATTLKVDMTKVPTLVVPTVPGQLGDAKATSAKAVANDKVEVKFDKDVTVSAADFKVTLKSDATKVIEVKEVKAEGTKTVVLTVEGLTAGTAYSVKVGETTVNFTAIAKVTTVPTIKEVKGTDFNRVEITFNGVVDKATAEDVANYVVEKATVVKATLDADRKVVELETEGLVKNTLYKITIENVKSADMVAMKKVSKTFRAIEDTIAPKVLDTKFVNNETIEIKFSESMDKTTLEDVANYKIPNLEVLSAKASKTTNTNDTVTLKTATQDVKVSYVLTVENLKDASVKANVLAKFTRTFRGVATDTTAPVVTKVTAISNTLVKVEVTESNLLNADSVADVANYAVDRNLTIVSAELMADTNKYGKTKEILVTTSAQETGNYKLTVKGIMDEFTNALKAVSGTTYRQYGFIAGPEAVAPLRITAVRPNGLNKVVVEFDKEADKTTAQDATNYVFNKDLGAATKATLSTTDAKIVTLETATQKAGVTYTITINGVNYKYVAVSTTDVKASFIALATEADLTAPTLSYVYSPNQDEVHLVFSEAMKAPTAPVVSAGSVTLTYKDIIADDTTLVFKATPALSMSEYTLTKAAATVLTDVAGNAYVLEADTKFYGSNIQNPGPTTTEANIEQVNAAKIKVTFDKNIVAPSPASIGIFTASVDEDDRNVLYLTAATALKVNEKITLDFKTITDMLGQAYRAVDTKTTMDFTPYISATDAPVMINAVATNNKKVELTFSEVLSNKGSYKIEKINDKGVYVSADLAISTTTQNTAKDKVYLNLATAMSATEIYYVKYTSPAINLGGKAAVTKDFEISFQGTSVVANDAYIGGVTFDGNKTVIVYDQSANKLTPSAIEIKNADGTYTALTTTGALAAGTTIVGYFEQDKTYKVTALVGTESRSFEFNGILATSDTAKGVTLGATAKTTTGVAPVKQSFVLTVTTAGATTIGETTIGFGATTVTVNVSTGAIESAIATQIASQVPAGWVATAGATSVEFAATTATDTAVTIVAEGNAATTGVIYTVGSAVVGKAEVKAVSTTTVNTGANAAGTITVRFTDGAAVTTEAAVTVTAGAVTADVATAVAAALNANTAFNTAYIATVSTSDIVITQKGTGSDVTMSLTIN